MQDHRYTVTFTCPSSISAPTITGIAGVNLVSTQASANGGVVVFDYTGATGSYPIAGAGCSVSVVDNGVSPTTPTLNVSGPFTPVANGAQLTAGATYLESVPPTSGQTLSDLVNQFTGTGIFSVSQSFDVGTVPTGWPSTDSDPNRWRVVVAYTGNGTDNLNYASNATVFKAG